MPPDRTTPLYDLDHVASYSNKIISLCFIVNGQLDMDVLHDALKELVTQWPVLTARLTHDKPNHRYGLLLPGSFENGRKPFIFTTAHTETPYPHMPSRKARLNPDMQAHLADFRGPSTPHSTAELLKQPDTSLFQVHVHAFSDVTCIGIHVPHKFTDLSGLTHILQAWCSLMSASEVKLPRVLEGDVVGSFGDPESLYPKTPQEKKVFFGEMKSSATLWSFWEMVWKIFLIIFYMLTTKEEPRLLFIPQPVVDKYRKETMDQHGEWVSENDVVSALLLKINLYNYISSSKALTVIFYANLRKQIPSLSLPQSESVFLHNALYPMSAESTPLEDMKLSSIPALALLFRHAIASQRPLKQVAMSVAAQRNGARLRKTFGMNFGPASGSIFHVTSWTVAKLGELDFSAAAARDADGTTGKVRFVGGVVAASASQAGKSFVSLIHGKVLEGKDGEAGYWCETGAKTSVWPEIEKYVDSWTA